MKHIYQIFGARYFGPFEVLDQVTYVAYRLNLPQNFKIHNVFHIS